MGSSLGEALKPLRKEGKELAPRLAGILRHTKEFGDLLEDFPERQSGWRLGDAHLAP